MYVYRVKTALDICSTVPFDTDWGLIFGKSNAVLPVHETLLKQIYFLAMAQGSAGLREQPTSALPEPR
jgi:hypothetical protein